MSWSNEQPATEGGSPKLPKLHHGVFSSASRDFDLQNDGAAPGLRIDCTAEVNCGMAAAAVTPSPAAAGGWRPRGGWMMPGSKERSMSLDSSKRIGFDGTTKTPSLALLKPTAASIGHRIAKVAHTPSHPYTADLSSSSRMQCSPNPKISIHQQCTVDNNAYSGSNNMSMDSPFKQRTPLLDPFQSVYPDDTMEPSSCQYHNHSYASSRFLDNKEQQHQHSQQHESSPAKRPLDHSPFPSTPLQRRQSEPVYKSYNEKRISRNVFDPVASQLLYQEEAFVSLSSSRQEEIDIAMDDAASTSYNRSLSSPSNTTANQRNSNSPNNISPLPLYFRKVSGSLHDVKTKDDLSTLARPVPRKLS